MLLTFREAAALIGQRSRSTIYRWAKDGWLEHCGYLRGEPGRWRIESEPDGVRPFKEWAETVIGSQGPMRQSELEPPEPAPEPDPAPWAHLPEQLRAKDGSAPFWSSYGKIASPDDEPLSDAEFWQHVHAVVGGMLGEPLHIPPTRLGDVAYFLQESIDDVRAGARWDAAQWANASAQSLLEYPEVQDGSCPHSMPELQRLAACGLLTEELQAAADAALLAYGEVAADG
jgi:hypothetical protein